MNRSIALSGVLMISWVAGCKEDDDFALDNTIEASAFTIKTPSGWIMTEQQGYESYVGEISGPQGVIYFERGCHVFESLDHIQTSDRTIYLKSAVIGGLPALIHKEWTLVGNNEDKNVMLSVFIDADDGIRCNRLYTLNPTAANESLLIEIMKTHRFR